MKFFVTEKDHVTSELINLCRQPRTNTRYFESVGLWVPELLAGRTRLFSDDHKAYTAIKFPVMLIGGRADRMTLLSQEERTSRSDSGFAVMAAPRRAVPMIEERAEFAKLLQVALRRPI